MSKIKYVVFDNGLVEDMIIFSDLTQHADVARGLEVVSAGFIQIFDGVCCYGDSISLGVKSRPEEDEKIARRVLRMTDD